LKVGAVEGRVGLCQRVKQAQPEVKALVRAVDVYGCEGGRNMKCSVNCHKWGNEAEEGKQKPDARGKGGKEERSNRQESSTTIIPHYR